MTQFLMRYNRRTEHGEIVSRFADDDNVAPAPRSLSRNLENSLTRKSSC